MATILRVQTSDGIDWHVEERGTGPDLILIPSGEGDCANFEKVASNLAIDFTVTTFDMPGMSRTTAPPEAMRDLTASVIATQIVDLLDTLFINSPATVYGCSSGGLITLALAAEYPDRVRSAIVHEVPLTKRLPAMAEMKDEEIQHICRHVFANEMIEDQEPWDALGPEYHARLDKNYVTWARTYVNKVERGFSNEELTARPVHWTVGAKSPMGSFFSNVVTACGADIPIDLLPCRHFPQVTIPDTLAEHIRSTAKAHL